MNDDSYLPPGLQLAIGIAPTWNATKSEASRLRGGDSRFRPRSQREWYLQQDEVEAIRNENLDAAAADFLDCTRGPGRPALFDAKRTATKVFFSRDERSELMTRARVAGMPFAAWIRDQLLSKGG